jgi:hypothetical protein
MHFLIFTSKHWPSGLSSTSNRISFLYLPISHVFTYIWIAKICQIHQNKPLTPSTPPGGGWGV